MAKWNSVDRTLAPPIRCFNHAQEVLQGGLNSKRKPFI